MTRTGKRLQTAAVPSPGMDVDGPNPQVSDSSEQRLGHGIDKLPMDRIAEPPTPHKSGKTRPRTGGKIVFYDAECGLCDSVVGRILERDKKDELQLAPLQGPLAAEIRSRHSLPDDLDSVLLVTDYGTPQEAVCDKAKAVAGIGRTLGGLAGVFGAMAWLPGRAADAAYDLLAKNRHRIFPAPEHCRMPTPEVRRKFIDVFD